MRFSTTAALAAALLLTVGAYADVDPGLLNDFESGTLENWDGGAGPVIITSGGPAGVEDQYLSFGNGGRLAAFNQSHSGVLNSEVVSIQVDMRRPAGESDLDMRLVLFGPGTSNRWTSSEPQVVPGNGEWNTYTFSVLEEDLTQPNSLGLYSDLVTNLNRIMFRYDPAPASYVGEAVPGTIGLDNIIALAAPPALGGDANGDGKVDIEDLDILANNFGASAGATLAEGDFNEDGAVNIEDLDILANNFGAMATSSASAPEPSALVMLIASLAACGVGSCRR